MINCLNTNCYVIRGSGGDVLIDTGCEKYRNEIETWLMNYSIKLIILTHGHNDHIGNAKYFSRLYGAPIAMSSKDLSLSRDNMSEKLFTVTAAGIAAKAVSSRLLSARSEQFSIDMFIEDGQVIGEELGLKLKIIGLEGHTRGSVGVLDGEDLYLGDAAENFVRPSFPYLCESPLRTRSSLDKIRKLKPKRVFFGHGMPAESYEAYRSMFNNDNCLF